MSVFFFWSIIVSPENKEDMMRMDDRMTGQDEKSVNGGNHFHFLANRIFGGGCRDAVTSSEKLFELSLFYTYLNSHGFIYLKFPVIYASGVEFVSELVQFLL